MIFMFYRKKGKPLEFCIILPYQLDLSLWESIATANLAIEDWPPCAVDCEEDQQFHLGCINSGDIKAANLLFYFPSGI